MSLIVTLMSLDAALQSLDPFNNAAAREHYIHKSLKRASTRPAT